MSAIPKYIIKRMIPEDAVKNTNYGWSMSIINVISPLSVTEAPENINDLFKIVVDGKQIGNDVFTLAYNGIEATVQNPMAAVGVTVPVGGVIELRCKGERLSPGKHSFQIEIQSHSETRIDFERMVK